MLAGFATVLVFFPRWSQHRKAAAVKRWSRELLAIVRVKLTCRRLPQRLPPRCLFVLNHVSWLDIFAVDAVHPVIFVAKSEIGDWPVLGVIARAVGTVFIERGSRRAARRTNEHISAALNSHKPVACFPEGATSHGHSVGRFHGALFQPAIDTGATVQPVAIRYLDGDGRRSEASAYVGDDSLMKSVWTLISHPSTVAELHFLPTLNASGCERREFAQRVREEISRALRSS